MGSESSESTPLEQLRERFESEGRMLSRRTRGTTDLHDLTTPARSTLEERIVELESWMRDQDKRYRADHDMLAWLLQRARRDDNDPPPRRRDLATQETMLRQWVLFGGGMTVASLIFSVVALLVALTTAG